MAMFKQFKQESEYIILMNTIRKIGVWYLSGEHLLANALCPQLSSTEEK